MIFFHIVLKETHIYKGDGHLRVMKAVIEHLEPKMYEWCILEYSHISLRLGKENVIFTNVRKEDHHLIQEIGTVYEESIHDLAKKEGSEFSRLCLLDPKAEDDLIPLDINNFTHFVFGGILGDHPMKGRTEKHFSTLKAEKRRLGDKQMSTDTAVIVCHKILDENQFFLNLEFQDGIEIQLDEGYSQVFPYRYLIEEGKLVFTPGLIELLEKEDVDDFGNE